MTPVEIWHNPACGTSRNVLALIRNSGLEPTIRLCLKDPPDRATLRAKIAATGLTVRQVLRQRGTPYDALGLGDPALDDERLIDRMLEHPILINRTIVTTPLGVRLCRPSQVVLDILPDPQRGPFTKEGGEPVIDSDGRRIL